MTLRQTLFLGAGLGILLPALVLAYFQILSRFDSEVDLRVRAPLQQYADVLARGVAIAIWNVDTAVATELVEAVLRNPDVVQVTVTNEFREVFVRRDAANGLEGSILTETRDVYYNQTPVGHLTIEMSTGRVTRQFLRAQMWLLVALAAQVVISFSLIWLLFDRRLVRPLLRLQDDARRLASGDMTQAVQWDRADEVGALAQGLDTMRVKISGLLAERERKNLELESELVERRRVEEALGLSQVKFSAIFESSPVAMSVSHNGGDFAVQDVNSAWVRVFGRPRDVAVGSSGLAMGLWRDATVREQALSILTRDGDLARYPAWLVRGDGGQLLCEVSGKTIALGDQSLVVLAYEDITEKHQYEENMLRLNAGLEQRVNERTRELSEALQHLTVAQAELVRTEKMSALGSMVAGIAHELNTPIGNSLTVASTLQDHARNFETHMAAGIKRSKLEEFVGNTKTGASILMRSLQHAADLVSSFKQVAVDQTSLNRRAFHLKESVAEILLTLGPGIRKTTHVVHNAIEADIVMDSYPGPLGQVLTNLVNNAVVHAFEGRAHGNVWVHAEVLRPGWVTIRVRDDGVGIPPENLGRVFDPFFTTRLGQGGSGLGLNIVYNLVHKSLGGTISAESTLGVGTCFTIVLPLAAESASPEETPPTGPKIGA
jgi:PAS domain S-box-containing protein